MSETDNAAAHTIKLHSMKVIIDVSEYYGCEGVCSSRCHRTVWS
jgi:hypothetical protein